MEVCLRPLISLSFTNNIKRQETKGRRQTSMALDV